MSSNLRGVKDRNWSNLLSIMLWGALSLGSTANEPSPGSPNTAALLTALQNRVSDAERSYSNFEIDFETTTEFQVRKKETLSPAKTALTPPPTSQHLNVHAARQGELFRVQETWSAFKDKREVARREGTAAYDGNETRTRTLHRELVSDQPGHEILGRIAGPSPRSSSFGPHLLLWNLADLGPAVPLSIYLGGEEAFRNYDPNPGISSHVGQSQTFQLEYHGTEKLQEMLCEKVSLHCVSKLSAGSTSITLWLAESRNFLPIRLEHHFNFNGTSQIHPSLIAEILEFRKLASGIWFPVRGKCTQFLAKRDLAEEKPDWLFKRELQVKEITLTANHDHRYFSDIPLPPETPLAPRLQTYQELASKRDAEARRLREAKSASDQAEIPHRVIGWLSGLTVNSTDGIYSINLPMLLMVIIATSGVCWLLPRLRRQRHTTPESLAIPADNRTDNQ